MKRLHRVLLLAGLLPFAALIPSTPSNLVADEGQWLPEQIANFDWDALRDRGLELGPSELWDGAGGGLLTAAVRINGCSSSFVSGEGLILTNHHCGYGAVNQLSTPEKNLLRDGFVAGAQAEELPAPGVRVSIVRKIEDVTQIIQATAEAAGEDPAARHDAVQAKVRELVAEAEAQPNTNAEVVSYFEGREWRRIFRTVLRDVRLVFAPPAAIGEYGGDIDNWMWPRHTGDFTFFRAYVAPDGSPAAYAAENVPYQPPTWLKPAVDGVVEGDLVMILGYPGSTNRYMSSLAVRAREQFFYPARLRLFTDLIDGMRAATEGDEEASLKIASYVKSLANAQKNAEGMIFGLKRNRVFHVKKAEEEKFQEWVGRQMDRQAKYRDVLNDLLALDLDEIAHQKHDFVLGHLARRPLLLSAAIQLAELAIEREKPDLQRRAGFQERDLDNLRGALRSLDRRLAVKADAAVLAILLDQAEALPEGEHIPGLNSWLKNFRADGEDNAGLAARLYAKSVLLDVERRLEIMSIPKAELHDIPDPLIKLALVLYGSLKSQRERQARLSGMRLAVGTAWIAAQQEWRGSEFYPDANRTLRVSIASIKGYSPQDGVWNRPHTTVDGMVAKNTGAKPFAVPLPVLRAHHDADYGRWKPEGFDSVPVCFLSDGDTTGGNSGSPVVNGRGQLVGLNFDRVFENVVGDFGWNSERSRNISVDVRFILWLLDRVYPAQHLLTEMGVAKEVSNGTNGEGGR